jgi:hypothetical protein
MMVRNVVWLTLWGIWLVGAGLASGAESLRIDDAAGQPGEWGFRPEHGTACQTPPPGFVWRPQKGAVSYTIQCARTVTFDRVEYEAAGIKLNCHCPPKPLAAGEWFWRFRFADKSPHWSAWSKVRRFTIPADAVSFPMPGREELLGRIPKAHPRLFIRPEDVATLRERARTDSKGAYDNLVRQCEKLLKKPPSTEEPPKYPEGTVRLSEEWRETWWGNRGKTAAVLDSAATLAFTRLIGGRDEYGQLAKRLLLAAAEWDPKGATGYRYNDEAGMPYAYYFSRTYSFVNDLLTEEEQGRCRRVMRIRGQEMYNHLCPRHIWAPYASHSNRAWHFLGEVGVAFLDEIPEAADWVWFAMNVFFNVYPVWCDDDGGWHEGSAYWNSYVDRFTWWADVMKSAMGIDAYRKPYFSKIGYYPMYLQPPGTNGGGLGDLAGRRKSADNRSLMTVLAAQARKGYWQWYVDAIGGPQVESGYVGFIRGGVPGIEAKPPTDLPSSRCFRGIGQAMLNTNLLDGRRNIEVIFKSSPLGTQSHGYDANNSFALYAFGERLLIPSGERDIHGSEHHTKWMHETKSTNCVTIDGQGQLMHAARTQGQIMEFHTSEPFDYVCGNAGKAYGDRVSRFTRHILFIKPELILIFDRLETPKPSRIEWWLHAPNEIDVRSAKDIRVQNNGAECRVTFLAPEGLRIAQTNRFDPPPRPRLKLTQWHLTATTSEPISRCEFVTLLRPYRKGDAPPEECTIQKRAHEYLVRAKLRDGQAVIGLKASDDAELTLEGLRTRGDVAAIRLDASGHKIASFSAKGDK